MIANLLLVGVVSYVEVVLKLLNSTLICIGPGWELSYLFAGTFICDKFIAAKEPSEKF